MQIQCKSCGKAYQVDEHRLTPEGVHVKCRSCGTILLLRLGKGHETAAKAAEPHATEPVLPGYRFCIFCGRSLDQDLSAGTRPVCRICEARKEAAVSAPAAAVQGLVPSMPIWKKILLFILLVLVILFAAFMGYQMALGSSLILTSVQDFHGLIPAPDTFPIFSGAMGF
ncbi:MAG: zinc-ribbon domain-containing protein [bacterium]